jgi:YVTN family beta-propeller protein
MRRLPLPLALAALLAAGPALAQSAEAPRGGLLVVLNKRVASASLVDAASGRTVATLPTGNGPHEVAVSPDGRTAVVADYGEREAGGTLTVLDLAAREVARTIALGEYRRPHGIAFLPDGRRVAVTVEANRAVIVVDVERGAVEFAVPTEEEGTHLLALAPDGRRAWTANLGSGSVSLVDLAARRLVRTAKTGPRTEAIDLSPDGRELWVGDNETHTITVLDAATLAPLDTIPSGGRMPIRLRFTPDGRHVLVSNMASSTLALFDARRRAPVATIEVPAAGEPGARPIGILMDPRGGRAWVAAAGRDEVAEVDLGARRITRFVRAGENPDGLGFAPAPGR